MTEWSDIARENLKAAQALSKVHLRSCTSRAYYAAFSAVTFALRGHAPFRYGRETPPHQEVTKLMQDHLAPAIWPGRLRELKAMMRRLYNERITADYRSRLTIERDSALQSCRDAHAVCRALGVDYASG